MQHHTAIANRPPVPVGQRIRGSGNDVEKYCVRCDDWWPATPEYFFRAAHGEGGLFYCCKACFADWRLTHPRKQKGAPA